MAGTYSELTQLINQNIKTNGEQSITGELLNNVLRQMVNELGAYPTFAGFANPSTTPIAVDPKIFYIATEPGTYANFGNLVLPSGYIGIFRNSTGNWSIMTAPIVGARTTEGGEIFNDYEKNTAGYKSRSSGSNNKVSASYGSADGANNTVSGEYGRANGVGNTSSGVASSTEGSDNQTTGQSGHTEGASNVNNAPAGHVEGFKNKAQNDSEHAEGRYNLSHTGSTEAQKTRHSIGVGTSESDRKNAVEVMANGDVYLVNMLGYNGKNPDVVPSIQSFIENFLLGMVSLIQEINPGVNINNIPVQQWWRLLYGKPYVPGFVGGWKAYGRSNDEDADTRDILPDYSGNGRDIKLYNFGWTEDSGYNTTTYPGALVSDGVDDYGQCVKDFALPDDYTVVALRKYLNTADTNVFEGLISKTNGNSGTGAFLFEFHRAISFSYGLSMEGTFELPALFSYMSKNSYNGVYIGSGNSGDLETYKLRLFTRGNSPVYKRVALYDLRIYDHSLTAEELQTVKDEMMADYEKATGGGITDITYVADWDAKGRSNDEEETMRSQWIDKVNGRVINLNNYSFSEMSGWGGFRFDWSGWVSDINSNGGEVIREKNKVTVKNFGENPTWTIINRSTSALGGILPAFTVRVSGLKEGAALHFNASGKSELLLVRSDGIYSIPEDSSNPTYYAFIATGYSANEAANLVIEQLPVYPGALVSDAVDDFGKSAEQYSGNVGACVAMGHIIDPDSVGSSNIGYLFNFESFTGISPMKEASIGLNYNNSIKAYNIGQPSLLIYDLNTRIFSLSREPAGEGIARYMEINSSEHVSAALYRVIFIKEQLDDAQVEFLKWKVEKEYRDWCKANGYEYAINEMLNN